MDVISAALTICSVCNRIIDWISNLSDKETLLKDISFTVLQVHDLLHPFTSSTFNRSGTGEYQLSQSIRSVGAVVRRIDEHIQVYQLKKTQKILAFLKPGAVIQKLKDDQTQLNHQLVILLASIAAVGYFRDHEKDEGSDRALAALTEKLEISSDTSSATMVAINTALDELKAEDAREFWKDYIGIKIDFVATDLFTARLISWFNGHLTPKTCDLIVMRLDEFNSGIVTPQNLARALGKQQLRIFVEAYTKDAERPSRNPVPLKLIPKFDDEDSYGLKLPLLVWIDDRPHNNSFEVGYARRMGVQVIQLLSTAEAKIWIDENFDFLCKYDDPTRIRFISDNVRLEAIPSSDPSAGKFLNASAGQNLLQYLRGRLLKAPVLIYTNTTIKWTAFVMNFEAAGSTTDATICLRYISHLAARGIGSDDEWRGFKVRHAVR